MLVMPLTSSLHIYFGMLTGLGSFWIIPMGLLCSVFVLLCFSTVYIQAHYAIDALAGLLSGTIIYYVLFYLTRKSI